MLGTCPHGCGCCRCVIAQTPGNEQIAQMPIPPAHPVPGAADGLALEPPGVAGVSAAEVPVEDLDPPAAADADMAIDGPPPPPPVPVSGELAEAVQDNGELTDPIPDNGHAPEALPDNGDVSEAHQDNGDIPEAEPIVGPPPPPEQDMGAEEEEEPNRY
jgi:hypothetical protein